jgi:hypothetical protein
MPSSGILRRVAVVIIADSEGSIAPIIRVENISALGTTLAVASKDVSSTRSPSQGVTQFTKGTVMSLLAWSIRPRTARLSPSWDVVVLKTLAINIDNRYNIVWRRVRAGTPPPPPIVLPPSAVVPSGDDAPIERGSKPVVCVPYGVSRDQHSRLHEDVSRMNEWKDFIMILRCPI